MAFTQNLGGNVVNMYSIIDGIVATGETCDYVTMFRNYGKMFRILLDVEPLIVASLEG